MTLTVKTAPTSEPVAVAEAKDHLRVSTSASDTQISAVIQAARERAERYLGRALVTQTLVLKMDAFPSVIELPRPPIQSVGSVKYVDTGGSTQTLGASKYKVDKDGARIVPTHGNDWPATRATVAAVTVEYTAGYGDADAVPQAIKNAILLTVERLYDRPASEHDRQLAAVASDLLWPYRQVHV